MSKMKELNRLIHDMEETAKYYLRLVDEFKKLLSNDDETVPKPISPKSEPQREIQLEDVRAVLATKAKDGFKNEVRALLNAYGASSLSALDPKHFAAVLEEAGGIGNDEPRQSIGVCLAPLGELPTFRSGNRRYTRRAQ